MKYISEYKIFESMVDRKIQLLEDLALELKDAGLQVDIINGKDHHLLRDPRISIHTTQRYTNDLNRYIVMRVTDDNNVFNADLYYTDTMQDFIETLKSFGMNPRSMSGGNHFAIFKFNKWGGMTDSTYLKSIKESVTEDEMHNNIDYPIYEFFEDLKSMQWGYKPKDTSELKKWSDHFIGRGYFDKISKSVDSIFDSFDKVDLDYVGDRMLEVWDELPYEKEKRIYLAIAYGSYEKYDKDNYHKFNGLIHAGNKSDKKTNVIIHMIKDIIYPTIFIGTPSIPLRRTNDQIYVTDEKWNCENFNIDNYDIEPNKEYENGNIGRRDTTTIYPSDFNELKLYHVDKVIEMHRPCLVMDIGNNSNSHLTGKISLSKLEPLLDDVLETILPELDYEDIIWDKARGRRQFSDDEFYDYTLKILLN
jgi:hypothetical protein